ncbi:hypothetical protein ASPCAL04470 [Aspergillus calidoustus]|uniref:DUF1308 domain-containing protein n=1 Tax=Aspergillus calidoustus TaxID=454130 RepID=A0A0U5FUP8_ASPCI|nr:hypothetical protein ASPCAL04470 [Aspergillus calidoustus]
MRDSSPDNGAQSPFQAEPAPTNPDPYSNSTEEFHHGPNAPSNPRKSLAESLLTRCHTLLAELDAFKALLARTQRNPQTVEVRSLRSNILAELKTLEKISAQLDAAIAVTEEVRGRINREQNGNEGGLDGGQTHNDLIDAEEAEVKLMHALRSSNLPFYEAVWTIAKTTCTGLVAFGKRFYWDRDDGSGNKNKDKRKSVLVDIVADDGEEWVKVSTISETRLLFEMAKKGWEADSEDEDGEKRTVLQNHSRGEDSDYDDDDDDAIELIKLAGDMRKAASLVRVNYRQPRLRFVIPKVEEGQTPEIDDLLKAIRGYGVTVECGEDVSSSEHNASENPEAGPASNEEEVRPLLPNRLKRFTATVNVDCTLLLAIISDLSHYQSISPSPKHHKAINRQIEIERERPLLSTELWPTMESRELICTSEAAKRMREIVDTIGTDTERMRMAILMGDHSFKEMKSASLIEELQKLSNYQVPVHLNIPIRIVDAQPAINLGKQQGKLPPVAQKVEEILSDINTSVFMYGWVSKIMTITSNRTVVKQIETTIELQRDAEDLEGPLVWVCDTARSLIGKEKGRKD